MQSSKYCKSFLASPILVQCLKLGNFMAHVKNMDRDCFVGVQLWLVFLEFHRGKILNTSYIQLYSHKRDWSNNHFFTRNLYNLKWTDILSHHPLTEVGYVKQAIKHEIHLKEQRWFSKYLKKQGFSIFCFCHWLTCSEFVLWPLTFKLLFTSDVLSAPPSTNYINLDHVRMKVENTYLNILV